MQPVVSAGWMLGSGEGSSLEMLQASRYNRDVNNVVFYDSDDDGDHMNTSFLKAMVALGVPGFKCFLIHSGVDEFPAVTRDQVNDISP